MSDILHTIIATIYILSIPLLVIILSRKWSFINKISPMMVLYCIGLLIGNIGIFSEKDVLIFTWVSNISVPIAIPLMLMSCNLNKFSSKIALKAFLTGIASIIIAITSGYILFYPMAENAGVSCTDYAKISAVMSGIYTGGIPNIGAISKAVDMPNNLYLLVTSYDLIITGLYLLFVIFFGKVVFRKLLPAKHSSTNKDINFRELENTKRPLFGRNLWKSSIIAIVTAIIIAAISYITSLVIPLGNSIAVLILILTTLSLGVSFIKPIQEIKQSFDLGLYCVYVFCFAIANMVNIRELNLIDNIFILYYIAFAVFGSLVLQILFAKVFKIDGDTVLVSSIALINSPPFVPMIAATLNNKDIILTGIGIGLLGYAIGNYLGICIYQLLCILC